MSDTWEARTLTESVPEVCSYCSERFRLQDVMVTVRNEAGAGVLRLHDTCLPRLRAAIPSARAVREAVVSA